MPGQAAPGFPGPQPSSGGGGGGTVQSVSVVSANGFAGSVATATTTPAITLSTTVTGVLKGNGTAISAASAGSDYVAPGAITSSGLTQTTARLLGRSTASTGAIEEITLGTNLSFSGTTLNATGGGIGGSTGSTDNAILGADGTGGATAKGLAVTYSGGVLLFPSGAIAFRQPASGAFYYDGDGHNFRTAGFIGLWSMDTSGLLPAADNTYPLGDASHTIPIGYLRTVKLTPVAFASLPGTPAEGMVAWVTDSNTATWGAAVAGGGANKVMVIYNGTNWTVVGK